MNSVRARGYRVWKAKKRSFLKNGKSTLCDDFALGKFLELMVFGVFIIGKTPNTIFNMLLLVAIRRRRT